VTALWFPGTLDPQAGALYVRVSGRPVARTVEVTGDVHVDLDGEGGVAGVEVLGVARRPVVAEDVPGAGR